MRFFLLMAAYGVAAIVLESTWLSGVPTSSVHFDFIIVAVAALAFSFEAKQALPVLVLFGLLMDVASSGPFGMSIFSYLIVYGLIRAIIAKISFQAGPALLFWVGTVSLLDKLISAFIVIISTGDFALPRQMLQHALPQSLWDAAVGLGVVPFLGWYWNLSWETLTKPKGLVMK